MYNPNTGIDLKKINRNRIFRLIYKKGQLSKQDIVQSLNISLPTVSQNLKVLKEAGLIKEEGCFASTGGRKARVIACNPAARFSIGVDITKSHVAIAAIDLCATIVKNTHISIPFENSKEYFRTLGKYIDQFTEDPQIDRSKILGVGISVPGLLSEDHQNITYASVLGFTDGSLNSFAEFIPYPCVLSNDASAAALAELWNRDNSDNIVYLSLSNSVGGAILLGKKFYPGENQRSAEFGHMTIVPGGRRCYCGQYGCSDAYCNASILSDTTNGRLDEFFKQLDAESVQHKDVWKKYVHYLTIMINNLRMMFDCRVILGGYVGSYMGSHIEPLKKKAALHNSFERDGSYLEICTYKKDSSAVGAAQLHIETIINNV